MRKASSTGDRVADYYRMSDDTQDKSIERQQSEVKPHCAEKRYRVVETCLDEGVSGSELIKRKGLQRTLALAREGMIDGVVVDDLDRYLRVNLLQLGELLGPLQRAGVWIESVAQGRFDYNSMTGRLMLGITSEAKHAQLTDNARRCLTQHLRMARDSGVPPLGKPPYGYLRVEDFDRPIDTKGRRPGKWIVNEVEAEIVLTIFKWAAEGKTTGWISDELYRRSVVSPLGAARWRRATVKAILDNPAYIGDRAWGRKSGGKHFRQVAGKVVQCDGSKSRENRPREEWFLATGTHPPIITDQDLWSRVRNRVIRGYKRNVLNENGEVVRREGEPTTPTSDPGAWILSRLLVCGKCDAWFSGFTRRSLDKARAYVCGRYAEFGNKGCGRCEVLEQEVVDGLIEELRRLLAPERQSFLREKLAAHLKNRKSDNNLSSLRSKVKELEARYARYRKRLLEVESDMVREVEDGIRLCREQLEAAKEDLNQVENDDPARTLSETVEKASQAIWKLEKAVEDGDRLGLRGALLEIVGKIILHSEPYLTSTGRERYQAARIEVKLLKGSGLELLHDLDVSPRESVQVPQVVLSPCA